MLSSHCESLFVGYYHAYEEWKVLNWMVTEDSKYRKVLLNLMVVATAESTDSYSLKHIL